MKKKDQILFIFVFVTAVSPAYKLLTGNEYALKSLGFWMVIVMVAVLIWMYFTEREKKK